MQRRNACWLKRGFSKATHVAGVGSMVALTILAEAGDLRRFGHHRQFLSYCGLDLGKTQLGKSRG